MPRATRSTKVPVVDDAKSDRDQNSRTILVVDDNSDDRELCVRALKKLSACNYEILEASAGEEAFNIINKSTPHCVLLDYSLPGKNGVELLKMFQREYPFLPIIMMTGQGNEAIAVNAIKEGASQYLIKSEITSDVLQSNIQLAIEQKSLERQMAEKDEALKKSQRELQKSQEFLNLIFDLNPDFLFIKDKDLKLVKVNKAFRALYPDAMQDNIIGATTVENYSEEEAEKFLAQDRIAFEKGNSDTIESIHFPRGEERTLHTQKIRFENSEGEPFILSLGRDVTDEQKLIYQLTSSNEELERFAFVASHDLQEPLRMVRNFTQLLDRRYSDKLDDQGKKYMEIISSSAIRLEQLVRDLLSYSQLTEESGACETVNVEEVLDYIKSNLQENISQKHAVINSDPLPTLYANPVRLSRVMQNLVGNAIKYQEAGNVPEIDIRAKEEDGRWLFSVRDNGIGMKQEYFEKIFQPFKRLHGSKEYPGSGMGLAICRKLVENMGGEMWVESEPGKGSTFFFTLPKIENEETKIKSKDVGNEKIQWEASRDIND